MYHTPTRDSQVTPRLESKKLPTKEVNLQVKPRSKRPDMMPRFTEIESWVFMLPNI
jgi:hypothetical protein